MPQAENATAMRDQHEIANLLTRWGHARDSDDWEALAACFHDDATISISWISAAAREFVAASKGMAARRSAGAHMKHLFSGPLIMVNGGRAFSRCHATLYARAMIDGHEMDFQSLFRFFDLLEKREGAWRILKRTGVYEKDRMDPVHPAGVPAGFYEGMGLSAFQPELRFLSFFLSKAGHPLRRVPVVYSPEEKALLGKSLDWLAGESG